MMPEDETRLKSEATDGVADDCRTEDELTRVDEAVATRVVLVDLDVMLLTGAANGRLVFCK
jgi:hypothetical protein